MGGKTISDWIVKARGTLSSLEQFDTDKKEDMQRLLASGLPQFNYFEIPYTSFIKTSRKLIEFLSKYETITIRALPNENAKKKGVVRKYKIGLSSSYENCIQFLKETIKENPTDYHIALTSYEPNEYGFILISGERYIRGEIAKDLELLSHGEENPLASLVIDLSGIGHLENKITWVKKEEESGKFLLRALNYIKAPHDNFNPIFLEGYFEGVVTKTGIKFLDFKDSPSYLS